MKIPRNIGSTELIRLLGLYGYRETRQTGSHIRLTTSMNGEHHLTIPDKKDLRIGTLHSILKDVADHFETDLQALSIELFEKK